MNWNLIIIGLLFIFSIFIIILSFINYKFKMLIKGNKEVIEIIYIIASIYTILSVIYGVYTFNSEQEQQRKIQDENNRIILENLRIEIHKNSEYISEIEKNEIHYQESDEFVIGQLDSYYLEKSRDVIDNLSIRENIFGALYLIKQSEIMIDAIHSYSPYTSTKKNKNDLIGALIRKNKDINVYLESIEEYINKKLA